jgi:hypothetical protein
MAEQTLAELILSRIGQDFDGECHLTEWEARQAASTISRLEKENAAIRAEHLAEWNARVREEEDAERLEAEVVKGREVLEEALWHLRVITGPFPQGDAGGGVLRAAAHQAALAFLSRPQETP